LVPSLAGVLVDFNLDHLFDAVDDARARGSFSSVWSMVMVVVAVVA
jgi:hypothetical protein